jgi:predicted GNAT superfamily acetyltransferase
VLTGHGYGYQRGRARARPLACLDFGLTVNSPSPSWRVALEAAEAASVSLSPIVGTEGSRRASEVVEALWGPGQLPASLIRAFEHAGTVILGAESKSELVGFVLGFPGLGEGLHMHSHMLGVLPHLQSRGIGYALKLGQRAGCLDLGIEEVRWTYDPLVTRNARFNLVKLGVLATGLLHGFYGEMNDVINRGDRSDRFEVRWRLESDRVHRTLRGEREIAEAPTGPVLLEAAGDPQAPLPKETGAPAEPGALIEVPIDYHELRQRDPAVGAAWRDASARAFQACFEAGLVAASISRDGRYVFEPAEDAAR